MAETNGIPTIPIALATMGIALIGAGGTIMQFQFSAQKSSFDDRISSMQHHFDARILDLERQIDTLTRADAAFRDLLVVRDERFVMQHEFKQYQIAAQNTYITQKDINNTVTNSYLTLGAWNAWRSERDARLSTFEALVNEIRRDLQTQKQATTGR
jgi:hypothetical protein